MNLQLNKPRNAPTRFRILKNPQDFLPSKHRLMYRLRAQLRNHAKFQSLYRKLIIHGIEWPKIPNLSIPKESYLLHTLVHKSLINLPRDASSVYSIKHSKGLVAIKAKKLSSSKYLFDKFRFELKSNSRSLRSLNFSFKQPPSLSLSLCIQIQINIFGDLKFLKRLESLSLSFANINEDVIDALSTALIHTRSIKRLALNFAETPVNNNMLATLRDSISSLEEIVKINLIFGSIDQNSGSDFFCSLKNLKKLTIFSLETRRVLPLDFFGSLLSYLENNNTLKSVSFSLWNSFLKQESIEQLLSSISHLVLERFWFGMNNLIDSESIFSKLRNANFKTLKFFKFHLTNSRVTSQSFSYLGDSLPQTLEVLNLKFKNVALHEKDLPSLLHNLKKLKNLEQLIIDLSLCSIDDDKFEDFIQYLPEKDDLKTIGISAEFNSLGETSLIKLANKIKNARKLKELKLDLKGNSITSKAMSVLIDSLKGLNKLSYLNLDLQSCQTDSDSFQAKLENMVIENVSSFRHDPNNFFIAL